jgi:hypothetical protein
MALPLITQIFATTYDTDISYNLTYTSLNNNYSVTVPTNQSTLQLTVYGDNNTTNALIITPGLIPPPAHIGDSYVFSNLPITNVEYVLRLYNGSLLGTNYTINLSKVPIPNTPVIGIVTPLDSSVVVYWTPGAPNASVVLGFTVTGTPGGQTTSAGPTDTSVTVTGLTNGTAYTFFVVANGDTGDSAPSANSASVTPMAPTTTLPPTTTTTTLPPTTTTTLPPTTTTTTQSIYFSIADLGDTFIVIQAALTINIYTATVQPTARLTQDISTNTITCYGLSPGTQYTVSAYVPGDPVVKTITATTLGTTTTTTTTTTHAPSQFTVIATSVPSGIGTVRIDWDYVPDAFKYTVSDRTNPPETITSLIQTVTFRNLVPGSVYIFMVTALAQNGSTISVGYSAPFTVPGV